MAASIIKPAVNGLTSILETAKKQIRGSGQTSAKTLASFGKEEEFFDGQGFSGSQRASYFDKSAKTLPKHILQNVRSELTNNIPENFAGQLFGRKPKLSGEINLKPALTEQKDQAYVAQRLAVLKQNMSRIRQEYVQTEITETEQLVIQIKTCVEKVPSLKQEGISLLALGTFIREINMALKTLLLKIAQGIAKMVESAESSQAWASTGKRKLERGAQIVISKTNRHRAGETNVLNMLQG